MDSASQAPKWWKIVRGVIVVLVVGVLVVLLMLWLMGTFHRKISTEPAPVAASRPLAGQTVVAVEAITVPVEETAVGTVQPVHRVDIASKLLAKVLTIDVRAGQWVTKGQVLVRLDDNDLKARLNQATAAVDAAKVAHDQAKIEYERVRQLRDQNAASQIELDRVTADFRASEASLQRARELQTEAQVVLGYATIHSPIDGTVVDKKVEAGDTVSPGQILLSLYDPKRMQLVASVRESLAHGLKPGDNIPVAVDALKLRCEGLISEIVPEAESASRSFQVKVTGPCPPGVYPGMFGRLIIPVREETVLVVPKSAVREVGQLRVVEVVQGDRLVRRMVTLGRDFDERVEVLSGLRAGEQVAVTTTKERT